ncbi:MAG: nucleotide exchange factor GrpE [Gammaproteobacteria bacterium]|nr:nucleotide exchange factor GrpE [Gammaproteobacteria bacterium]
MKDSTEQAPAELAQETGPVPEPTAEQLQADAEARAAENRAAYLRAVAELDNFRKRMSRELEAARQFGVERFATAVLPVADSLGLGLDAAATADPAALAEGHRATLRQLQQAFASAGIAELDPTGQPFDPQLHEAMTTRPSAEQPPNTVLLVVQKGYLLNGRLLRPARVIVSTAPEQPPEG